MMHLLIVTAMLGTAAPSDLILSGDIYSGHATTTSGDFRMPNTGSICWDADPHGTPACLSVDTTERLHIPPQMRHIDLFMTSATKGPTAPADIELGQAHCWVFNQTQTAETGHLALRVPSDWDGTTDWVLELHVYAEGGDVIANGEVIEFTATYRSLAEGEAYDNGTAATVAVLYTQVGAGVDKAGLTLTSTLDANGANQPMTANDMLFIDLDLHEVNTTYSGNPALCAAHVNYISDKLSQN